MGNFEFYLKRTISLIILITFLVGVFHYKSIKKSSATIVFWFICFTLLNEIISYNTFIYYYFPESHLVQFIERFLPTIVIRNNIWVNSIYSLVFFYIYLIYFKSITKKNDFKKVISLFIVVYTFFVGVSLFHYERLLESWLQPHMYAGVLLTLFAIFLYLMTVLKSDNILTFHKTLPFWITMGILFFNLVTMPIFIFAEYLNFSSSVYVYILVISNYIMYGCFIVGFIINAREQRKLQ